MANEKVNRYLNIYIESGDAQKALDKLLAKEKQLTAELARATNPRDVARLKTSLDKLSEPIDRARRKLSGELSPSVRDMTSLVNTLGNRLKRMSTEDADFSKVLAQYGEARARLQQLKAGADQLGAAQKSIAKESFIGSFFGNLAANGISRLAGFIQNAVGEALQLGRAVEGIENRFKRLNDPLLLEELRKATRGTVSDIELMRNAIRADNFKIPLNQLGTLFQFASRRARETGDNVQYLVESIILGISRKSIPILDNLGISATEVQRKVKETGDFASAAISIVNSELEKMGEHLETEAEKTDRLNAEFENLKTEIGQGLVPVWNFFLDLINKAIKGLGFVKDLMTGIFSGRSISNTLARLTVDNTESGQQAVDDVVSAELATLQSQRNALKKRQENGELLKFTEADITKEYVKTLQQRVDAAQMWLATLEKSGDKELVKEAYANFLGLQRALETITRPSHTGGPRGLSEEELKKLEDARKKAEEEYRKLVAELAKIRRSLFLSTLNALEQDLSEMDMKYADLQNRAKNHNNLLQQINELALRERLLIIQRYARLEVDEWGKSQQEILRKADQAIKANLDNMKKMASSLRLDLDGNAQLAQRERLARAELRFLQSAGRERLAAELKLLKEQESAELLAKEHTESEKLLIEEKYRQMREQAEMEFIQRRLQASFDFFNQVLGILTNLGDAETNRENAALERDRRINEKKQENLERRLRAGTLSQQQYDREIQKLQKSHEKREKEIAMRQFERNKRLAIAQALINGAQGIIATFAARPGLADIFSLGVARAIQVALIVAATATQIGAISSQRPEFAKGGKLNGPSHDDKSRGMPVYNPYTRQIQAYVEGGEGIVNKRTMADRQQYSISGTPSQIISMLNSRGGGVHWEPGARISPSWQSARQPAINYPAIRKYYALGGKFQEQVSPGTATRAENDSSQLYSLIREQSESNMMMRETVLQMQDTITSLQRQLAYGIQAYTILSDQERQSDRMNRIRQEATMR